MREKEVSIIGGADGPTSIFIAGRLKTKKKSLKESIKQCIYRCRCKRAEKRIFADPHTLKEVVSYAKKKYHAKEIPKTKKKYAEQYASAKQGLIIMHRPELLGELKEIFRSKAHHKEATKKMQHQIQLFYKKIANIPDDEMPMDFHIYEIRIEHGWMEMQIDFKWDIFAISYSGNKKTMKELKKIARDLYLYYGVTEEDIKNRTKRYSSLLTELSS